MFKVGATRAVTLMALLCTSCIDQPDCFITDQVRYLDRRDDDGTTYYLYYKLTGWQEKTEFIYLYDQEPLFDRCGQTEVKQLFATDIGPHPDANVLSVILQPNDSGNSSKTLLITYSDSPDLGFIDPRDIRFAE